MERLRQLQAHLVEPNQTVASDSLKLQDEVGITRDKVTFAAIPPGKTSTPIPPQCLQDLHPSRLNRSPRSLAPQ